MELKQIVRTIAGLIPAVDRETSIQNFNQRTKRPYVKGVPTLREPQFVNELVTQWRSLDKQEGGLSDITDEFPYPVGKETCDIVLSGSDVDSILGSWEWAIEIKYLRLVGNNGNNNDYVMQKAISPYLKDRSLVHDVEKLGQASFAKRKAVIFYGFDYWGEGAVTHAEEVCDMVAKSIGNSSHYVEDSGDMKLFLSKDLLPTPKNLARVLRSVGGEYTLEPLTKIIDSYLTMEKIAVSAPEFSPFEGLVRHPCGNIGRVVGWEVR